MPEKFEVHTDGVKAFRRDLRKLDRQTDRLLQRDLKDQIQPVLREARLRAPHRSGRLASSLRPFVQGGSVGVVSRLPYANVVHWGGTIRPRGYPIRFRRTAFLVDAFDGRGNELVDGFANSLEVAAARAGWRRV